MKRAGRRALLKLKLLAEANDAVAGATGTLCGVQTADPVVALTFDDGPHARNTEVVLSVLADRGARATFFVVGKEAEKLPTMVAEVLAAGHEVGFHTHDHVNLADSSPWRVWQSVHDGRRRLEDLIGRPVTLFRPP
jgi:peptidoglycan/xylan/chitin deacetylase (PgdA/CDA1 family)